MNFPIILKTPDAVAPDSRIYHEVASNGIFQIRDTAAYRAVTRSREPISGLLPEQQSLELRFPRLSCSLLEDVLAFFAEVYRRHKGEAIVILFYRSDTREFRVEAPPQKIPIYRDYWDRWRTRHELTYGSIARPGGFLRFGTIHSHADEPAYSSWVDCEDERFEDALHIVFGGFSRPSVSRSAAFVANGERFRLDPDSVMEACAVPRRPARSDWLARVETRVEEPWAPIPASTESEPWRGSGPAGTPPEERDGSV